MTQEPLASRHCAACTPGTPALGEAAVQAYLPQVPQWSLSDDGTSIRRRLRLADFPPAIDFVNRVAALAEEEQHHPDIRIFGYRNVELELSTHAIGGLSENDFILAARIDQLLQSTSS
jgi:4a-hydroxytetrahydrobiopterin dehydratase